MSTFFRVASHEASTPESRMLHAGCDRRHHRARKVGRLAKLRLALLADPVLLDKVERICAPRIVDPYAQRYHFWMNYVKKRRASL